jgi:hypothetical protein
MPYVHPRPLYTKLSNRRIQMQSSDFPPRSGAASISEVDAETGDCDSNGSETGDESVNNSCEKAHIPDPLSPLSVHCDTPESAFLNRLRAAHPDGTECSFRELFVPPD